MSIVKVENLTVIYLDRKNNKFPALVDFSCDFQSDCVNIVLGESGCGKTTLFKAICGLFSYDGYVYIDGIEFSKIPRKNRSISYLSQDLFMFGHMIVYDILAYALKREKYKPNEIDLMVKNIAEEFSITQLLTRKPHQLSIGQKQLVLLAKSFVKKPKICFLDEPFSNLDPQSLQMVVDILKKYLSKNKTTLFVSTHKIEEISPICDYLCYIENGKCKYYGKFTDAPKSLIKNEK